MKNVFKHILLSIPFVKKAYQLKIVYPQMSIMSCIKSVLVIKHRKKYWYTHKSSTIQNAQNIFVGINSLIGARPRCYIQGIGGIYFGNYIQIGPNVAVLSANHDLYDQRIGVKKSVIIADYCWIGTNSVILPGVILGKRTIVAAGSIVTKSFPDGFCVIAGNPARIIKNLDRNLFDEYHEKHEFYGFTERKKFEQKTRDLLFHKINLLVIENSSNHKALNTILEEINS